ncbi:conserved hypothetical protein [Trichinella spiralis]|uniref:hypothetical protein n=1 Tax=Trichinella spiralis TaxID=6334 RepID=UPI0001EFDC86|nr:conserved hypothetical protein [Trichinella spiralis]
MGPKIPNRPIASLVAASIGPFIGMSLFKMESCEFQKGKKRTHFYRWRGPQSFQQRKCSQSDSISKQQSLVKTALLLAVTIASFDIDRDALMKDATLKCVSRVPYSALK